MANKTPAFQALQHAFTAHIRDPDNVQCPDNIEDRRMDIYRDLFFNNILGFLENGFPVLRSHYDEQGWRRLARAFFSIHDSHSPYFIDISKEFVEYLQAEHQVTDDDPDYLFELAHFEWAEVALMIDQETPDWDSIDPHGDMLTTIPVLSPTAFCLAYAWPVHLISHDHHPTEKPDTPSFVIIYRDTDDDVQYMEANPVLARIMELLQDDTERTGRELLLQLATEMQHPNPEEVVHNSYSILLKLLNASIILGTSKPSQDKV